MNECDALKGSDSCCDSVCTSYDDDLESWIWNDVLAAQRQTAQHSFHALRGTSNEILILRWIFEVTETSQEAICDAMERATYSWTLREVLLLARHRQSAPSC
jgi:hypothetical protein